MRRSEGGYGLNPQRNVAHEEVVRSCSAADMRDDVVHEANLACAMSDYAVPAAAAGGAARKVNGLAHPGELVRFGVQTERCRRGLIDGAQRAPRSGSDDFEEPFRNPSSRWWNPSEADLPGTKEAPAEGIW